MNYTCGGIINKYLVQNDTAYGKWYNSSMSYYTPDTATLSAFEKAKKGAVYRIWRHVVWRIRSLVFTQVFKAGTSVIAG